MPFTTDDLEPFTQAPLYDENERLKLAYKRLSEMYLEFGTGRVETREMAIRSIFEASLEALRDSGAIAQVIEKAGLGPL